MFIFSTSNIKKESDRRFVALRLEGFVLRVRYMLYQAMIVAFSQTPSLVSASILVLESIHLSIYFYYCVRYRYPKNWILIVSKFNVGLTIIFFAFLAFTLSIK